VARVLNITSGQEMIEVTEIAGMKIRIQVKIIAITQTEINMMIEEEAEEVMIIIRDITIRENIKETVRRIITIKTKIAITRIETKRTVEIREIIAKTTTITEQTEVDPDMTES
jgi:hypothetical protein